MTIPEQLTPRDIPEWMSAITRRRTDEKPPKISKKLKAIKDRLDADQEVMNWLDDMPSAIDPSGYQVSISYTESVGTPKQRAKIREYEKAYREWDERTSPFPIFNAIRKGTPLLDMNEGPMKLTWGWSSPPPVPDVD